MSTEKAPAFQFYASDFLSDANVQAMETEAIGAYILLLCFAWREVSICKDYDKLARMTKLDTDTFLHHWNSGICDCFIENNDGFTHPRLDAEREKQANLRIIRSESGKLGGRPKGKKAKGKQKVSKPLAKESSSSSSSTSLLSIPEGIDLPDAFKTEFLEWMQFMKQKKKPLSEISIRKQIKFLLTQPDPIACIDQSIRNNYQGIFELNTRNSNGTTANTKRFRLTNETDDQRFRDKLKRTGTVGSVPDIGEPVHGLIEEKVRG